MSRHVDRERAQWAATCIQEIHDKKADWASDYRSDVRGLPALVQSCGLAQTIAFYRAKAKGNDQDRYGTVARHLCQPLVEQKLAKSNQTALQQILALDTSNYRRATLEVQAFLLWLKRFAEAQLPEKLRWPRIDLQTAPNRIKAPRSRGGVADLLLPSSRGGVLFQTT